MRARNKSQNRTNELKLTRLYDAPVEAVWDAWTDPEQTAKWWGPRGFTLTTHSKDLRVGGHWHYTMHGPDGTDYPNQTKYFEVDEYKRLVYDHGAYEDRPPLFRVTVVFTDLGDQTRMEMTMAFPTPEVAEQSAKFIKDAGGYATWDRLAEFLAQELASEDIFVISRSFEVPINVLFNMWVDPNHFSRWLGPVDARMEFIDNQIAAGQTSFYKMIYGDGTTMFGKMQYLKIDPPHYLEYTQIFCDEFGKLAKHPRVPVWPDRMLTRAWFAEEAESNQDAQPQTRVTVIWRPDGETSREEVQAFLEMRAGMTQGWTQAFDKLEALTES